MLARDRERGLVALPRAGQEPAATLLQPVVALDEQPLHLGTRVHAGDPSTAGPAILSRVTALLAVWHVIVSIVLVILVLMHSGRDTGFTGFGFTPASQGGQHVVERNLTRLTVVVAIIFVADTIGLFYLLD